MVLLNQRVLQLDFKRRLVEVFEGGEHRQAPNELRNQAILQKVLGHFKRSSGSISRKTSPALRSSGAATLAPKPMEVERPRRR